MQQRNSGRLNVFVDDSYAFSLDGEVAAEVSLQVGAVLTDELRTRLEIAEQRGQARARAVRFLGHRERSRGEVARRLAQSGYPAELVDEVCDWLEGLGYVDDERYGAAFARQRRAAGWGARRIAAELERSGVDRDVARAAAAGPADEAASALEGDGRSPPEATSDDERLVALVARRFGAQLASRDAGAERRASAFLARRGHDWQTIRRVLVAVVGADVGGPSAEE